MTKIQKRPFTPISLLDNIHNMTKTHKIPKITSASLNKTQKNTRKNTKYKIDKTPDKFDKIQNDFQLHKTFIPHQMYNLQTSYWIQSTEELV